MTLTPAQRAALDQDGYVLVPGALADSEVARLLLAFAAAPPQQDGTQHVRVTDETPGREAWGALHAHPVVVEAAAHLLGTELSRAPRAARVDIHGRNPLPGYGQQGLHADWPARAAGEPFSVATFLWMLDDFAADNGATRVVPGTHLEVRPVPKALAQPSDLAPRPRQHRSAL